MGGRPADKLQVFCGFYGFEPLWIFCVLISIRLRMLYYNGVMY